jgi:uncharacterized membrane protein YphA (DoxX/SURF4 family)
VDADSSGGVVCVGLITPLACVMLACVMIMAIATTAIRNIKASSALNWLSEFLYLPEALLLVILLWLFFSGAGWLSVDHLILF